MSAKRRAAFPWIMGSALAVGLFTVSAAQNAAQPPRDEDTVTDVDSVTVRGEVPVPRVGEGAPLYTANEILAKARDARLDQVAYFNRQKQILTECYIEAYEVPPNPERLIGYDMAIEAATRLAGAATSAEDRTREAQELRRKAAQGEATMAEVEAGELRRQEAVLRMMRAEIDLKEARAVSIDIQELVRDRVPIADWRGIIAAGAAERSRINDATDVFDLVPRQYRDLKLENVAVAEKMDAKGEVYVYVSGAIRNTRPRRIEVPPLSVTAVDEFGYALVTESASARGRIEPGQSFAFGYELKPTPIQASSVVVTFADPRWPVWLYPASADPVCTGEAGDTMDPTRNSSSGRSVIPSVRSFRRKG